MKVIASKNFCLKKNLPSLTICIAEQMERRNLKAMKRNGVGVGGGNQSFCLCLPTVMLLCLFWVYRVRLGTDEKRKH